MSRSAENVQTSTDEKSLAGLRLDLSEEARMRQRDERRRQLNAVYIPRLRLIGSFIIAAWLYLHIRYISGGTFLLWLTATSVLFGHALLAWFILDRYYRTRKGMDVSLLFLTTDLLVWIWLIYITGAEQSWLFFLLSVRAADQTPSTFRRTFYFANLGALLYIGMLGMLYLQDRSIDWGAAWSKASIIYGFNLYLSLAAKTTESIRRKMTMAIRLSRTLIHDLEAKQLELSEALSKSAELERSLAQAQKLESLGHMATGIAHDFHNTMMSALPWTELVAKKGQQDPELRHAASRIRSAIERAREVTSHLLGFAQPKRPDVQVVDLSKAVRQEILRLSLPEEIQLRIVDPQPFTVEIDPSQFARVLMNLTLNARDAMPEGGVLTMTIRAAAKEEHARPEVGPDTHVALDVTDTGTGIDPETAARVFDPFFTTKEFGKGTGLGLSVVHRTVQEMGGFIYLRSKPGEGSTFTLVFPRASATEPDPVPAAASTPPPAALFGRSILIVDDDPAVLEGLEMMLDLGGASVTGRNSGRGALQLLEEGYSPDAIILDLGMPEMGGGEVHAEIRRRGLSIPVVISSGYGERERIDSLLTDSHTFYLQKPYNFDELERVLAAALAGR